MNHTAHSSEKEETPAQEKILNEAEQATDDAREIVRRGGFDEADTKLRAEGRLDREVMRVKALYGPRLAEDFMTNQVWEALTIMELFHPETSEHCVETYRIARDKIERPLLGSGVQLKELFKEEHISLPVFYRACLLHDIGKVDVPYEIIANTVGDHDCAELLCQHWHDPRVHDALKRNGIEDFEDMPSDPQKLTHDLAVKGHRPMQVAPAELLFSSDEAGSLRGRNFDVDTKTLAELIQPHEEYSGTTLQALGLQKESEIAAQHHNYQNLPIEILATQGDQGVSTGVAAEILHLADVEQAMKAHRGYKQVASDVAAMAAQVHDAEFGRIKNIDFVVVWVRDGMERLALDPEILKEILHTPTEHAYLGTVMKFLNNHNLVHLGTHTVPIAPSPEEFMH